MKTMKIFLYILGLIASILFLLINQIVGNSWLVIVLVVIFITPFCYFFFFLVDKYINPKLIYLFYTLITLFSFIACVLAFLKGEFINISSQSSYIAVYLAFSIYIIKKKLIKARTDKK